MVLIYHDDEPHAEFAQSALAWFVLCLYFTHHANKPKGDFIPVTLETDLGLQQASV